jgi:DNA-binding HxlR family transcriptional regulator
METGMVWHDAFLKCCPSRVVLALLSDKWTLLTVCALAPGPMRFGELRRRLDGISQKVLTATLRELERAGLVDRRVFPTAPPRVEYSLTELGHSLDAPFKAIKLWAEAHLDQIESHQEKYDQQANQEPAPLTSQL